MTTKTLDKKWKASANKLLDWKSWLVMGFAAAVLSAAAVIIVQSLALTLMPELAEFKPLESYPRSVLFTVIPAFIATALFAFLVKNRPDPIGAFLKISIIVLLVSFIPDFILPVPGRTLLASSTAAFLHLAAAIVTVSVILNGYRIASKSKSLS